MRTRSGINLLKTNSDGQPWETVVSSGVTSLVPADSSLLKRFKTSIWRGIGNTMRINISNEQTDTLWEESGSTIVPKSI
jgi:hypothetical protein